MIEIRNKIIPFKGFKAINLFGIVFIRKNADFSDTTRRHETIHTKQMREMLYIGFYLWYVIEYACRWIWRRWHKPDHTFYGAKWMHLAYYDISLEQEAYDYQHSEEYIKKRKHFAWVKYLRIRNKMKY